MSKQKKRKNQTSEVNPVQKNFFSKESKSFMVTEVSDFNVHPYIFVKILKMVNITSISEIKVNEIQF